MTRRIAESISPGEKRLYTLLVVGFPNEVVTAQVYPWQHCTRSVDVMLPLRGEKGILLCHDGDSHERAMPQDRIGRSKLHLDREWDLAAMNHGYKVVRLHHSDEHSWENCISVAIAQCANVQPVYSPWYLQRRTL